MVIEKDTIKMEQILMRSFEDTFSKKAQWIEYCSASFNLVGSEVDYVGGKILKLVTSKGVWVVGSKRDDKLVRIYSINKQEYTTFSLDELEYNQEDLYSNHFRGVFAILELEGVSFEYGMDFLVFSDIPIGWRFANIAPLEMAVCQVVDKAYGVGLTHRQLVFFAHEVGNCYVDIRKGTVHYLPLTQKDAGKVLIFDHTSSISSLNEIDNKDTAVLVISPKIPTDFDNDLYRTRHKEYQNIYRYLKYNRGYQITKLAQINRNTLTKVQEELDSPKRELIMEHLVGEAERIQDILEDTTWETIGKKMIESQLSLNFNYDKYEVDLENTIGSFRYYPGVLGYRYTIDNHILLMIKKEVQDALFVHLMHNPLMKDKDIFVI